LEFLRVGERDATTLTSRLDPDLPTVPEARFVRVADATAVLRRLDELAERVRERLGHSRLAGGK
jgi:hypothetical protein